MPPPPRKSNLPKPYYDDGKGIVIYCGDCRDILPKLTKADLILTDPPYGLKWSGTGFKKQPLLNHDEVSKWDKRPDLECINLLKKSCKHITVWGFNYLADLLGPSNGCLVWDKMTGANPFADGELAYTTTTGTMRIFHHQWCGAFKASERNIKSIHPTQKPIALMAWCLSFVPDAKTVFDPFMGSGTTLRACKDLSRACVGIELEEKYCEIAAIRLQQEILL